MKRCDGSATLKNMSRLFCAIIVDTATLQQNETICPLTPGNLTMESLGYLLRFSNTWNISFSLYSF